ncbi:MAG: fibrobacter succinogenes major paralogous domain-containing protein [Bacteroidales bacterium]|nr:fibrobacter succinogenes major paralogous domain-containing protein [Bacteroidales bacterium]
MMKKSIILLAFIISCAISLMAQAPENFTYQAVVRDASNALLANTHVSVRVSIAQGSMSGTAVYSESHVLHTNENGLLTLTIGSGYVIHGDFSSIQWSEGPYFMEVAIDPNGGNNYTIVSSQQLLSVPYALYAQTAGNGFSGSYNDLTDLPEIPTNVSAFTNDAGYVTWAQLQQLLDSLNNIGYATLAEVQQLFDSLNGRIDEVENTIHELHDTTPVVSCPGMTTPLTDYDGNVYSTVQIGSQCWMKDNLRTSHYADGTIIAQGVTTSTSIPYRYRPDNNSLNVETHGYLYNWKAVMRTAASSNANPSGVQGICPTGWHVPSDAEWTQLTDYVSSHSEYYCGGDSTKIAKSLAYTSGWMPNIYECSVGSDQNANNATGFSVRPSGYYIGSYSGFGSVSFIWSSTDYEIEDEAWYFSLFYGTTIVGRNGNNKFSAFSVRCLRD